MADEEDHYEERLTKFLTLANIPVDSPLVRGIKTKFSGRRFCMMLGGTIKDWWEDERFEDKDGNSLFSEDQILLLKALPSYLNDKQHQMGPRDETDRSTIYDITDIDSVTEVDIFLQSHNPDHLILYSRAEAENIKRERDQAEHVRELRLREIEQQEEAHQARMEQIRSGARTPPHGEPFEIGEI